MGGHAPIHLQPDGRAEASAAKLCLERPQQILGRVVVQLEIACPRHPERVVGNDLHAREEEAEVRGDDLLERHEGGRVAGVEEAREKRWDLDPGEAPPTIGRVAQPHRQVQRQVRDVREWMPGVHRQRGQDGKDPLHEGRRQHGPRIFGDLPPAQHLDAGAGEPRLHVAREHARVARGEPGGAAGDQLQLACGIEAIRRDEAGGGELLAPQGRHPHLVELVQVACEDREELDTLEQRKAGVLGESQDALVEVEPRQLPIQKAAIGPAGIGVALDGPHGRDHQEERTLLPDC